jgi:hypothetical protein
LPHFSGSLGCLVKEVMMNSADQTSWSLEAVQQLIALARERVPVSVMSLKLKRPVPAIHAKLAELGISPPVET